VDDEPKILNVVSAYLEKEGYQVFTASNGKEALELAERKSPDLIILDLRLPDIAGEEVCQRIRQKRDTPILMLTAKVEEEDKIRGLAIGADDYLTKPFSPRELVARVKAILRRVKVEREPQRDIISFDNGRLRIDISKHEVLINGKPLSLTPNEFRLLIALARYPGRVYTRSELINKVQGYEYEGNGKPLSLTPNEFRLLIALARYPGRVYTRSELINKVQGYEYEGYDRTIDAHVKNLRQKIEEDPKNPRYILTVFGVGYKFGGEEDAKTSLD